MKRLAVTAVLLGAVVPLLSCGKVPEVATVGKAAPDFSLVDREGVLREKFIGPVEWDAAGPRETLLKYLSR